MGRVRATKVAGAKHQNPCKTTKKDALLDILFFGGKVVIAFELFDIIDVILSL